MWTHSGIFVEKKEDELIVYASDKHELDMLADANGRLHKNITIDEIKEDGLYQLLIGYGSHQDLTIYSVRKIAEIDWEMIIE